MKKAIKIQQNRVAASFVPGSFNDEDNTIDLVWSVGARGERFSWSIGSYFEELSMKKSDVRLERLNNGAPLLKDHRASLDTQFGVVDRASIKNKEGLATVRFSEREEFQGLIKDVKSGVVRNVSVGYRVHSYEDVSKKGDEIPTYRAVDWTPMEISFVPMGFDDAAQSRSLESENINNSYECELIERQETEMPKGLKTVAPATPVIENDATRTEVTPEPAAVVAEPVVTPEPEVRAEPVVTETTPVVKTEDEIRAEGAILERTRCTEINEAVKKSGLKSDFSERMISENKSIEETRTLIIEQLAKDNGETNTRAHNVEVSNVDNKKTLVREAATRAILHREMPEKFKLEEGDNQFRNGGLLDVAREVLTLEGTDVRGIYGEALAKRALHHSSDFGAILENVTNKSLQSAYSEQPQSWKNFVREASAKDFKEMSKVQMGEGTGLEKVNEHGEYKRGTLSESAEKYKVEKFGKILGFTWELLLNDDLDAFARIPAILGRKARAKESELIYKIINTNPLMGDGSALFSGAHGNLGTGGVISETTMTEAKKKFITQVDLDGELIGVMPKFLYVPSSLETAAKKFMQTITPNNSADVNIFSNSMQIVVDPRMDEAFGGSDTAWYLMADKGLVDMVELSRLGGNGPQMFTREGFDVDGMETKIRYVFGVKALDHVGFFKNAGV